jgi:outer membrane protein assembly factor BamB
LLYVGIKGCVVALDRTNGAIVWTTRLARGSSLVPLVVENGRVLAISSGEVSCLDARTGTLVWHNALKGYGTGFAMLAGAQDPSAVAAVAAAMAAAEAANIAAITAATTSTG